jgi:prepilin signal peptidase PulO-like enzyme (type II secretory pathway)
MIVIAFIDLDRMIIPNRIVLPAVPLGLAAAIALEPSRWWVFLVAAVAHPFLFVLALSGLVEWVWVT